MEVSLETDGRNAQLNFTVRDETTEDVRRGAGCGVDWQLMHMLPADEGSALQLLLDQTHQGMAKR